MSEARRKKLWIVCIDFTRKHGNGSPSVIEQGIAIGTEPGTHDFQVIMDMDGKVVTDPWDYQVCAYRGAMVHIEGAGAL